MTLCAQYYVVYRRALPLWAQLGPNAGRPLRVQFTQAPGAFFATFTGPAGWAPGRPGAGSDAAGGAGGFADDPNIIDAEVVEDDDDHGPPELHAPR